MDADSRRKQELQNIEQELIELKRRQEERRQQRIVEEREVSYTSFCVCLLLVKLYQNGRSFSDFGTFTRTYYRKKNAANRKESNVRQKRWVF